MGDEKSFAGLVKADIDINNVRKEGSEERRKEAAENGREWAGGKHKLRGMH